MDVGAVGINGALAEAGDGEGEESGVDEKDDDREDVEKEGVDQREVGSVVGVSLPLSAAFDGARREAPSSPSTSSSMEGKKFLNRASACHLLAFLNSTQTSIRPGRERAGSRRSR